MQWVAPSGVCACVCIGYLSYKHYKGATGATALKKLGQAPPSGSPLSAGLANLERMSQSQSQPQVQQLNQQQPGQQSSEHPTTQAYTGFAPQASGPGTAYGGNAQGPDPGQAAYPGQPLPDSAFLAHTGSGAGSMPATNQPQSYRNMLGSLAPAGGGSVQYPDLQSSGLPQGAGQYPNAAAGYPPPATGKSARCLSTDAARTAGSQSTTGAHNQHAFCARQELYGNKQGS